jgi:hypothetical protein
VTFALRLERAAPPLSSDDPHAVALAFLRKVGALSEGYDPLAEGEGAAASPPVRVLVDCFMMERERSWSAAEMAKALSVPVGQVYRTVLKFEALDWIAGAGQDTEGALPGKRFALRFGTLSDAWRFSELAAGLCIDRYGELAKTIEERVAPHREKAGVKGAAPKGVESASAREAFVMQLSDAPLPSEGAPKDLAGAFLHALGVIPDRTGGRKPLTLPSFRVFYLAFLMGGERWWSFEELSKQAPSTRPTLLKHIRRLEGLDLLERAGVEDELGFARRHWRLRHGSLARAFEFTDARARLALDSMSRWAGHLDKLVAEGGGRPRKGPSKAK